MKDNKTTKDCAWPYRTSTRHYQITPYRTIEDYHTGPFKNIQNHTIPQKNPNDYTGSNAGP